MKSLLSITAMILLLSCSKETQVTPDTITSIEYGTYFGLGGSVRKITVYSNRQVYQPKYQSEETCQTAITSSEWDELRKLVDREALHKVKVGEETVCPDASSAWIIARTPDKEIQAVWGACTGGDPTGIQPLIDALGRRMGSFPINCK